MPARPVRMTAPLIAALLDPACYPHPVSGVRVLETHISWLLLTGEYVYKIKKPVDLGFLNFTTPALRRHYCEEEVRLNRRLAAEIYLEVVTICSNGDALRIGGEGRIVDFAVKMREFPQEALASRALARGAFGAHAIDALAALIADFHARAPAADSSERFGSPAAVHATALQNFAQMAPLLKDRSDDSALRALRRWSEQEFAACRDVFVTRKSDGFVRECHGDLHLNNIVLMDGRPVPFDCIEFNDDLRWIDVMSEAAFLAMDLHDRGRADLAWRFLNRHLEASGDYAGLAVLRFYLVYRSLVRAKVHLMRSRQPRLARSESSRLTRAYRDYLRLASDFAARGSVAVILTHGLSGSGKTTATQPLIEGLGALRLRSDLERKRLHAVAPLSASGSGLASGIYTPEASAATYRRLAGLARSIVQAGYPVVIDAASLKRAEREAFRAVAEQLDVPFLILDFEAPHEILRARIAERHARADDASEADFAVLEHQFATREPLTPAEKAAAIAVDGTRPPLAESWQPLIERLQPMARCLITESI